MSSHPNRMRMKENIRQDRELLVRFIRGRSYFVDRSVLRQILLKSSIEILIMATKRAHPSMRKRSSLKWITELSGQNRRSCN